MEFPRCVAIVVLPVQSYPADADALSGNPRPLVPAILPRLVESLASAIELFLPWFFAVNLQRCR